MVRVVEIEGNGLGGVVSWDEEDEVIERGEEGWVVMTKRWNGGGGWVRPLSLSLQFILSFSCSELIGKKMGWELYRNLDNLFRLRE